MNRSADEIVADLAEALRVDVEAEKKCKAPAPTMLGAWTYPHRIVMITKAVKLCTERIRALPEGEQKALRDRVRPIFAELRARYEVMKAAFVLGTEKT